MDNEQYRLWLGRAKKSNEALFDLISYLENAEPYSSNWYFCLASVQAGIQNLEDTIIKVMSVGKEIHVEPV